jgi:hypothetical protein
MSNEKQNPQPQKRTVQVTKTRTIAVNGDVVQKQETTTTNEAAMPKRMRRQCAAKGPGGHRCKATVQQRADGTLATLCARHSGFGSEE